MKVLSDQETTVIIAFGLLYTASLSGSHRLPKQDKAYFLSGFVKAHNQSFSYGFHLS